MLANDSSYMLEFGKVGCAPLIGLLGIAENSKTSEGKYVNERSRFGKFVSISSKASICTYLALHLFDLDRIGKIGFYENANIEFIKNITHLSRRVIIDSLAQLTSLGYISCGTIPSHGNYFPLLIPGYHKIYKKANRGGTGYININMDFIKEISSYENINMIRLVLRFYIILDNPSLQLQECITPLYTIRSWLPEYITIYQIESLISDVNARDSVLLIKKMEGGKYHASILKVGAVRTQFYAYVLENHKRIGAEFIKMNLEYEKYYSAADSHKKNYGEYPQWITVCDKEQVQINRSRTYNPSSDEKFKFARLASKMNLELTIKGIRYVSDRISLGQENITDPVAYVTTLIKCHPDGFF